MPKEILGKIKSIKADEIMNIVEYTFHLHKFIINFISSDENLLTGAMLKY